MRYDILLTIDYSYQTASDHVRNILRLVPQDGPSQRVTAALLTIDPPPDERRDGRDFFGNATSSIAWHEPVQQITFCLSASAERFAAPVEHKAGVLSGIKAHFLQPPHLPERHIQQELRRLVRHPRRQRPPLILQRLTPP